MALLFGNKIDHSLLYPNQLQHHSIVVEDTLQQFNLASKHAVIATADNNALVIIPLSLKGIFSSFESTLTSNEDIIGLPQLHLTSDAAWDPYLDEFVEKKKYAVKANFEPNIPPIRNIACCKANTDNLFERTVLTVTKTKNKVTPEAFALKFGCRYNTACRTL